MLKRLLDASTKSLKWLIFKKPMTAQKNPVRDPHIIPRDQHSISRKNISKAALKVMSQLLQAGYQAYLVGGGVRDLLLGGHPKDFDVATDATPEQVKSLFRGSRIIGRRFKIVHVRFGREIIEVTTFRGSHDDAPEVIGRPGDRVSAKSEDGMLLRDNVYGTLEEDAARRDFTINALYYTTRDFSVYDYCNGLKDLQHKTLRIIGDAETRYREDPVRMLRAVRFAAKLGFQLEEKTAAPIASLAPNLKSVAAARMFDEVLKLLMAGYGEATFTLMRRYGLFTPLFPASGRILESGDTFSEQLLIQALRNTDQRIAQGKPVTPAFIYAALLWPAVCHLTKINQANGMPLLAAAHHAAQQAISEQQQLTAIPKRFSMPMREIWDLQERLPRRSIRQTANLLEHPRFRASYDFLLLREQAGENTGGLGSWWTEFQTADDDKRQSMCNAVKPEKSSGRRRPRYHNKPRP